MYMDFGLYEDEGNFQDIVKESNLPITFTNDAENPWLLNGANAINGNQGKNYSTSTLKMGFTNTYTAELKFDWFKYRYYSGGLDLQLYIDGVPAELDSEMSIVKGNHTIVVDLDEYKQKGSVTFNIKKSGPVKIVLKKAAAKKEKDEE